MDTLILQRQIPEKNAASITSVIIAIALILSQTLLISAHDADIGNYTGLSPALSYIKEEQSQRESLFDKEVRHKYVGAGITDIEKGVKHVRMIRYYNGRPVRINLIEFSSEVNDTLEAVPAIASERLAAKTKISKIAERENAIAAINGGYFKPQTGVPLGTLMINKKMYTGPIYDRVAMGIFENGYEMARVQLKATVDTNIGGLKIDNINQPRMLSTHTLVFTPDWGEFSPPAPKYGKILVIENGKLISQSYEKVRIPENGFVISGPEKNLNNIIKAKKYKLNIKMTPDWDGVKHIVSGGPYLVRNGEIYVDVTAQRLASITGRNPRTAIGYTKDKHLIMMTADGREGASIGLTLTELAYLMKEFGCINAMNLDGGGSTVMYIKGQVVNRPPVSGGIPLSQTVNITSKKV